MAIDYFISLGYLVPLLNYVKRQTGRMDRLLDILSIAPNDIGCTDRQLPDRLIDPLFDCAATMCNDSTVGLHAGKCMTFNHIGILGPLMLTCTKASQVFNLHERYSQLVGNGAKIRYQVDQTHVVMRFSCSPGRALYSRHLYEFNLAGWMTLLANMAGEPMYPDRVEIPTEPPVDLRVQQETFQCELMYREGTEMRLYFGRFEFEHLLSAGDSSLRQAMETAAQHRMMQLQQGLSVEGTADQWLLDLQGYINRNLAKGGPSIEQAALASQISIRTLQRRLKDRGLNYQTVINDARKSLCERLMQQQLSLLDVALLLGFTTQSSFHRSFKQWFGCTPTAYLNSLKN